MSFDKAIDRRGTYCTQWDFVEDRFGEADLLPFTISDTDFAVPEAVLATLQERLKHPVFGYTRWNHPQFKRGTRQDSRRRLKNTGLCIPRPLSMVFLL